MTNLFGKPILIYRRYSIRRISKTNLYCNCIDEPSSCFSPQNKSKLDITGNNSLQDRFETRTVIREPSDMRDKLMNLFLFSSKLSFVGEVLSFAATTVGSILTQSFY